jgi:uncharacterized membrane protein
MLWGIFIAVAGYHLVNTWNVIYAMILEKTYGKETVKTLHFKLWHAMLFTAFIAIMIYTVRGVELKTFLSKC